MVDVIKAQKEMEKTNKKRNTDLLPDTFVLIKLVISSSYQIRNVTVKTCTRVQSVR